jgi:hypothetical protein
MQRIESLLFPPGFECLLSAADSQCLTVGHFIYNEFQPIKPIMNWRRISQFFWLVSTLGSLFIFTNLKGFGGHEEMTQALLVNPLPQSSVVSDTQIQTGENSMMWRGKIYVRIAGRWYLKSADDVYTVNGVKTYFVDKSAAGELARGGATGEDEASGLIESLTGNPFGAYSPTNIQKAARELKKAKANLDKRDTYLENLPSH